MMSIDMAPRTDLKRSHDTYDDLDALESPCCTPPHYQQPHDSRAPRATTPTPKSRPQIEDRQCLAKGSERSRDSAQIPRSPSPVTPLPPSDSNLPPQKKSKLSFQEKELKRINKDIKDREKAEEKARKEQEKAAQAADRARKEAEKEIERQKKEAEKSEKEAEKRRKEAEKEEKRAALQAERAAKEEKRQRAEDEKRKKERSQLKLGNFFAIPTSPSRVRASSTDSRERRSASPVPQNSNARLTETSTATPSKSQSSDYEKAFPAFFIQSGVTVAPANRFERDPPATEHVERNLDGYISGAQAHEAGFLDAASLFDLSSADLASRGKQLMPVRAIMDEFYSGKASKPIDLTSESQSTQTERTRQYLEKIPMKFLRFREDVRPPYYGTYTSRPKFGMTKLARNPLRRDLPHTDYDYDSEAEWVEDDGEDLKSGDEDEELDDEDDMDGFLDDENDELAHSKRLVLQGDLEPVSTGLCWEDRKRRNTNVKMMRYRMENILDPSIKTIDPFSTSYWQASPITKMDPPRVPLHNMKTTSLNFNALPTSESDIKPIKSFFKSSLDSSHHSPTQSPSLSTSIVSSKPPSTMTTKDSKPKKYVPAEDMEEFKAAIAGSDLTKIGLVEVLKKRFTKHPAAAIKATLEVVAKRGRPGEKNEEKRWYLVDGGVGDVEA